MRPIPRPIEAPFARPPFSRPLGTWAPTFDLEKWKLHSVAYVVLELHMYGHMRIQNCTHVQVGGKHQGIQSVA